MSPKSLKVLCLWRLSYLVSPELGQEIWTHVHLCVGSIPSRSKILKRSELGVHYGCFDDGKARPKTDWSNHRSMWFNTAYSTHYVLNAVDGRVQWQHLPSGTGEAKARAGDLSRGLLLALHLQRKFTHCLRKLHGEKTGLQY